MLELYYYTNCTQTATARITAVIDNTPFVGEQEIFEFPAVTNASLPPDALFLTHKFTGVTLTSLHAGQTIQFVLLTPLKWC